MLSHAAFIDLCEQELRLCAVAEGETLVVVSQGDERAEYAAAFLAAGLAGTNYAAAGAT